MTNLDYALKIIEENNNSIDGHICGKLSTLYDVNNLNDNACSVCIIKQFKNKFFRNYICGSSLLTNHEEFLEKLKSEVRKIKLEKLLY